MSDLKQLIDEEFEQVTAEKWTKCCAHVESVEKKYWQNVIAVEKEIERVVIDGNSDDSDVNTSDNDDESYDEDSVSVYHQDTYINSTSCSSDEILTSDETSTAGQQMRLLQMKSLSFQMKMPQMTASYFQMKTLQMTSSYF